MTSDTPLDATFWSARMSYLSRLARTDALAVIVPSDRGYMTYASHNVPADADWLALGMLIDDSRSPRAMATAQPLADGRTADGALVASVAWKEQRAAALVGLKIGAPPTADELAAFARVAELVGLELAETVSLQGAIETTRDLQRVAQAGPQRLLERATARLAQVFRADGVSIMLADESGELSVRAATGLSESARRDRKKIGEGISGTVAQTGRGVRLAGAVRGGNDPSIGEALVAPMRAGDRTIGVVNVKHGAGPQRYDESSLRELTSLASDIAGALTTAQELERANDDRAQAILLYELGRLTLASDDPSADLESVTRMIADTMRAEAVGIWTIDGRSVRLRASTGYGDVLPHDITFDRVDPALRSALRDGKVGAASFGASEERPDWAAYGATNFVVVPIASLGALVLGRASRDFARSETELATTIADFLASLLRPRGTPAAPLAATEPALAPAPDASASVDGERVVAEERKRFAQELHDGLAQELTGLVLALEAAQRAIGKDATLVAKQLGKAERDARGTLLEVRRYMAALRQTEGGQPVDLPVLLTRLVDDLRRQTGLEVEVDESGLRAETDRVAERALLRIVGEALRNVATHSGATRAKVTVEYRPDRLSATVQDDGKGFDAAKMLDAAEQEGHFGLVGMRERAEGLGGQVVIRSEPGRGTVVHVTIPFDRPDGTIEDVESGSAAEDTEQPSVAERPGILGRILRR
ncbi:MAG TPA: GAF domain-containing sensor histidine kinase [Candidatus Limnocylindria bacterium]|nr:GAF domain-containing sensor histidine kinase [Candidatus Limnocylindria bacterium]